MFASVSVCARACVHACVRDVFAIYDNYILPRLIMIIIKIIILYFIQIRHSDDFSIRVTRLVIVMKQTSTSTMRWKVMNILKTLVVFIHIIT